jgi:hypothetical protein
MQEMIEEQGPKSYSALANPLVNEVLCDLGSTYHSLISDLYMVAEHFLREEQQKSQQE